ncbi:Tricin synthase 1 [Senna tora]|uniref:Tricin synthase 1 n=1 Tax=Senna tora TaxID=362788 RepID=A0A834TJP0_9FABA|nr:Tricin synthase 1 [Senna tora]
MASTSSNVVLHHSSMLAHERTDFLLRPARVVSRFHSLSSNCAITNNALHAFSERWGYRWKSPFVRCCSTSEFVIANDEKYGNKQVVSLTPRLYDYVLKNVREPEILRQLREETASMRGSQMQVSPDQAQLLAMLVQTLGAERCIEVGVYTGYSSLAIALVLPESGCLVACERDARSLDVAKKYYHLAGVSHKVDVKLGLAEDTLESLILDGEAGSYDFAFIDAEKRMTQKYFELLLQLVRIGGLIVIDNVLWHGKVADPLVNDAKTVSIRNFNQKLVEDKRVSISMVGTDWRWDDNLPEKMTENHKMIYFNEPPVHPRESAVIYVVFFLPSYLVKLEDSVDLESAEIWTVPDAEMH